MCETKQMAYEHTRIPTHSIYVYTGKIDVNLTCRRRKLLMKDVEIFHTSIVGCMTHFNIPTNTRTVWPEMITSSNHSRHLSKMIPIRRRRDTCEHAYWGRGKYFAFLARVGRVIAVNKSLMI